MTEPDLLVICAAAFVAVIALLSFLAGVIRLLTAIFPVPDDIDAAVVAAVSSAAARAFPGTRVTNIKEIR